MTSFVAVSNHHICDIYLSCMIQCKSCIFFFYCTGDHRDLHVLAHSFPTRRSSDLPGARTGAVHPVGGTHDLVVLPARAVDVLPVAGFDAGFAMTIGEFALLPVEEAQLIEQVAHWFLSSLRLRTTGPTGRLINLGLRQPRWLAHSFGATSGRELLAGLQLAVDAGYVVLVGERPLGLLQPEQAEPEADERTGGNHNEELRGGHEGVEGQVADGADVAVGPGHAGDLYGKQALDRGDDSEGRALGTLNEHRAGHGRSEEHTSELQSLMRISYAVFCWKKKKK